MDDNQNSELASIQSALEFNAELTAASQKKIVAGHAMVKADMFMVSVEDLHVLPDFNPRIKDEAYKAHIRSLADSILENGFYQNKPIAGYGVEQGKKAIIYVTDGHCRLAAVHLAISEGAPITEVPVVLCDKSTSMEDLTIALVRTNDGKRFTPIELAVVCKRLISFGWKPAKIASKLSITVEYVNQLLTLAGAPSQIREMVQQGQATASVALGAKRAHGGEAAQVLDKALTVAKASGKNKLTAKFLPDQQRKSVLNKTAPRMYEVLEKIQSDQVYETLSVEIRDLINELVQQVKASAVEPEGKKEETVC